MAKRMSEAQVEQIRELNRQRWNALMKREEKQVADERAKAKRRLRIVRGD
jgi:hypothetical protein